MRLSTAVIALVFALPPLVSAAATGQPNGPSHSSVISSNGKYVAFFSDASNLVAGDSNDQSDLFLKDLTQGTLRRITGGTTRSYAAPQLSASGRDWPKQHLPGISADGKLIAFVEARDEVRQHVTGEEYTETVYESAIVNTDTGARTIIPNVRMANPVFSGDSRYLVFTEPRNVLQGGQVNGVILFDRITQTLFRIGGDDNSLSDISHDGRFVVYDSCGDETLDDRDQPSPITCNEDSVDVFMLDRLTGVKKLISTNLSGFPEDWGWASPSISGDGSTILFSSVGQGVIGVWTRATGAAAILVETGVTDWPFRAQISKSGNAFCYSDGSYLKREMKIRSLVTNETRTVAERANAEMDPFCRLSADGTHVAFSTAASNIVPPDENGVSDVFVATVGPKKFTYLRASSF